MEWETVNKHLAHIDLDESKEKTLINNYEKLKSIIDFDNKSVMDYGCGGGYFANWLSDNYRVNYFGYDISDRSIQAASKKNPGLTFSNELFSIPCTDILVCLAVIQHMTKDQLIDFIRYCQIKQPEQIILQYRHGNSYNPYELVKRMSMTDFNIDGYEIVYKSKIESGNNYVYQLMHRK